MPPEKFFPKARSGGERRQNARNGDFPEAALDAAWVIGQWASRSPLTSTPPRWAFDVCAEFYLALSIVPNLLDREGVRGPKPRRDDLQKLIKISRVLAGYPDPGRPKGGQSISATGKPRSITKIIEDLYPRRMERKRLRSNVKRLSELYQNHVAPPGGEVASHILDLLSQMEVFSQGYYHMGKPAEPRSTAGVLSTDRITISVSSLVEALRFWVDALGSRVVAFATEEPVGHLHHPRGSVRSAVVQLSSQTIELLEDRLPRTGATLQSANEASISFSFIFSDLEMPRARLTAHGWHVHEIAGHPGAGQAFYTLGPDGCSVRFFPSS